MDHLASSLEVAGCFESRVILKELAEQSCSQTMLETFTVNPHSMFYFQNDSVHDLTEFFQQAHLQLRFLKRSEFSTAIG